MKASLVFFLCLVVASRSAPVNDAPSKSEEERDPGWGVGVEFGKRALPKPIAQNEKRGWGVSVNLDGKRGVALADQDRDSPSESEAKRGWGASVHFGKRGVALADQDRDSPSESEAKRGWGASVHFGKRGLATSPLGRDVPNAPDVKRGWGASVHFGKRSPPFLPNQPSWRQPLIFDQNDPSAHWGWKDTVEALGIAKDLMGKRDEAAKQGNRGQDSGDDDELDKWIKLAKAVIGLFQPNPANSQASHDDSGGQGATFGFPNGGDIPLRLPSTFRFPGIRMQKRQK